LLARLPCTLQQHFTSYRSSAQAADATRLHLIKGVVVAAIAAFLTAILEALAGPGLDLASYD